MLVRTSPNPGPIEQSMAKKLQTLLPTFLSIDNDSQKHAHHAGVRGASNVTESHFNIEIHSDNFKGKNLPLRHRMVYKLLEDELKVKGVHALQLKTKTPEEIAKQ